MKPTASDILKPIYARHFARVRTPISDVRATSLMTSSDLEREPLVSAPLFTDEGFGPKGAGFPSARHCEDGMPPGTKPARQASFVDGSGYRALRLSRKSAMEGAE